MSFPIRELGVIGALTLLSMNAVDGVAYLSQRFDRSASRSQPVCRSPYSAELHLRTTEELAEFWDESLRCSALLHGNPPLSAARHILNPNDPL